MYECMYMCMNKSRSALYINFGTNILTRVGHSFYIEIICRLEMFMFEVLLHAVFLIIFSVEA